MLVVGEKEVNANCVSVRKRDGGDLGSMPIEQFLEVLHEDEMQQFLVDCWDDKNIGHGGYPALYFCVIGNCCNRGDALFCHSGLSAYKQFMASPNTSLKCSSTRP